ncbi:hypothetical protein GCM10011611_27810 [Aliidongia dinghuensis]|uniref:HTH marR-type domain-containing protein n=1 Tax=Aliidongia dinghuensis TaxID=1867774 RepID=A0A8J2YV43_9PROT|nr:MarR family transcriptional regulator [Aliidongia dinghuensis]GGF20259.1 hypothetical protein GCM10011611_27810 [Aliidongia dinghuensis]
MYRLSDSFPYLIARLGIRMGDLFVQVIKRDGLSLQMYRVLAALAEEARPLKLGELAALTSTDLSTLSRIVAGMHKRGVLTRQRPENDQRSLQVTLTEAGRALADRYMPVAAHYEEVVTSSLTTAEALSLKATLIQLYENLDQLEAEIARGEIDTLIQTAGKKFPASRRTSAAPEPGAEKQRE